MQPGSPNTNSTTSVGPHWDGLVRSPPASRAESELTTLIDTRIVATLTGGALLPMDASLAARSRLAGRIRGFYWVDEFAAVIGRSPHYVSDQCKARVIKILPGGKPYRIPLTEETAWNESAA